MCVELFCAMLMALPHGLCPCSDACCDLTQFVAVWLDVRDSQVQQHITSSVFNCRMQC